MQLATKVTAATAKSEQVNGPGKLLNEMSQSAMNAPISLSLSSFIYRNRVILGRKEGFEHCSLSLTLHFSDANQVSLNFRRVNYKKAKLLN